MPNSVVDHRGSVRRALLAALVTGGSRRVQIAGAGAGDASIMTQRFDDDGHDTRVARAAARVRARLDDAASTGRLLETPLGGFLVESAAAGRYRLWDPSTDDAVIVWTVEAGCELHVVMHDDVPGQQPPCHPV